MTGRMACTPSGLTVKVYIKHTSKKDQIHRHDRRNVPQTGLYLCCNSDFRGRAMFAWQLRSLTAYLTALKSIAICCVGADKFFTALGSRFRSGACVLFALCH